MGLAATLLVDLAAARQLAMAARQQAAAGEDPNVAREAGKHARRVAQARAMTFKYLEVQRSDLG